VEINGVPIVFAPPTNILKPVLLELTSAQAEEILIGLALRRKQLLRNGVDQAELMVKLNYEFTKVFGWRFWPERINEYFKKITKVRLVK